MVEVPSQGAGEPEGRAGSAKTQARLVGLLVRLLVYLILVVVAVFSIYLIDRRAMIRMGELEQASREPISAQPGR